MMYCSGTRCPMQHDAINPKECELKEACMYYTPRYSDEEINELFGMLFAMIYLCENDKDFRRKVLESGSWIRHPDLNPPNKCMCEERKKKE